MGFWFTVIVMKIAWNEFFVFNKWGYGFFVYIFCCLDEFFYYVRCI